ncbi:MAG: chemotaxis protein CheD [Deltaproteobacteria bacterium]|nr:chemotaxis protein CheD [Deltaproteobacteria bacterium]
MNEDITNRSAFLEPARLLVNKEPIVITTVVGSGVAVTLWDPVNRYGGMCHFIFPEMREKGKTTVEYGNVAIYALIKSMVDFGSKVANLEAQIFGGGEPQEGGTLKKTHGPKNIEAAQEALNKYKVRIVSNDTGGNVGRKIAFNTLRNEVLTYKVEKLRQGDWLYL